MEYLLEVLFLGAAVVLMAVWITQLPDMMVLLAAGLVLLAVSLLLLVAQLQHLQRSTELQNGFYCTPPLKI